MKILTKGIIKQTWDKLGTLREVIVESAKDNKGIIIELGPSVKKRIGEDT